MTFYVSVLKNKCMYKIYTACDVIAKNDVVFQKHGRDVALMTSSTQNQFSEKFWWTLARMPNLVLS